MERTNAAGILLAAMVAVGILLLGCTSSPSDTQQTPLATIAPTISPTLAAGATPGQPTAAAGLSLADIAKHSTPDDCWVIVSGNVYDMSVFAKSHPAGPEKIDAFCGGDATQAFDTKGGMGQHSQKAHDKLQTLLVGPVAG